MRMVYNGVVDLDRSLDALKQAKKESEQEYQDGDPECIPLDTISSIPQPLCKGLRLCLVKGLFLFDEARASYLEAVEHALVRVRVFSLVNGAIDIHSSFL